MVETTKEYQASVYDKGVALFRKPGDEMKVLISGRVIAFSGHAIPNADGFVFRAKDNFGNTIVEAPN